MVSKEYHSPSWKVSYLIDRKQRVCVNNDFSSLGKITWGVHHGSILGPHLFNIFINDIFFCLKPLFKSLHHYTLHVSSVNLEEVKNVLRTDFDAVRRWFY